MMREWVRAVMMIDDSQIKSCCHLDACTVRIVLVVSSIVRLNEAALGALALSVGTTSCVGISIFLSTIQIPQKNWLAISQENSLDQKRHT